MAGVDNTPALSPPEGVVSNFDNPYSLSGAFIATTVLCIPLATFAVAIRLATIPNRPTQKFRIEDATCIVSWAGLLITIIITFSEIQYGLGRHQWDVRLTDLTSVWRLLYINRLFYSPTILAAKVTILLQLQRIFVSPTKRGLVFWAIQISLWLNVGFYVANVISVVVQCQPIAKAWDASLPGTCLDSRLNFIVTGVINVVSDVVILLLPLWAIWHLRMSIKKKLSVSTVFAVGIVAVFAGIMRLAYSVILLGTMDLTFGRMQHAMWTVAEISTAITCASLPLVPQFKTVCRRVLHLPSRTSSALNTPAKPTRSSSAEASEKRAAMQPYAKSFDSHASQIEAQRYPVVAEAAVSDEDSIERQDSEEWRRVAGRIEPERWGWASKDLDRQNQQSER